MEPEGSDPSVTHMEFDFDSFEYLLIAPGNSQNPPPTVASIFFQAKNSLQRGYFTLEAHKKLLVLCQQGRCSTPKVSRRWKGY